MVILVFGLPGSGKSFFAQKLAESLGASHLNSDVIRNELFSEKTYSQQEKQQVYEEMLKRMIAAIKRGNAVILDATFQKENLRQRFTAATKQLGKPVVFIEIRAEEDVIRERLSKNREESDADYEVYQQVKKEFEALEENHLVLHSGRDNINDMLRIALDHIKEKK